MPYPATRPRGALLGWEGTWGFFFWVALSTAGAAEHCRFEGPLELEAGTQTSDLEVADLDGDGRLDIAAANYGSADLAVFLGRGDGTFTAGGRCFLGGAPSDLELGDFNGDGILDAVTSNWASDTVSIVFGTGGGRFEDPILMEQGFHPAGIEVSDFDGDGLDDIALLSEFPDGKVHLSVLLSAGDGTFAEKTRHEVDWRGGFLAVTDLDSDGLEDAVTITNPNGSGRPPDFKAAAFLALPGGDLQPPVRTPLEGRITGSALADFDGDGLVDLATASATRPHIRLYRGAGDGSFSEIASLDLENAPGGLAVADFDADGLVDLASGPAGRPFDFTDVSILLGRGGGVFAPERRFHVGLQLSALRAADFDGDGYPDLAAAHSLEPGRVTVLRALGGGDFDGELRTHAGDSPVAFAIADFDGDGDKDLAVANPPSDALTLVESAGDGTLVATRRLPAGRNPYGVAVSDFDRDGVPDLVTANFLTNDLSLLRGLGGGSFAEERRIPAGNRPQALLVADLDGDGFDDIVAANRGGGDLSVLRGLGDGTFAPEIRYGAGKWPVSVIAADFDRDGVLDLAAANWGSDDVTVLLGAGALAFAPARRIPAGVNPNAIAAFDLDGDPYPDLVTANYGSGDLSLLRGRGDGSFEEERRVPVAKNPISVAASDVDLDGIEDLLVGISGVRGVFVLLGAADGSYAEERILRSARAPSFLAVEDLDGDGSSDLVAAHRGDDDIALRRCPFPPAAPALGQLRPFRIEAPRSAFAGDRVAVRYQVTNLPPLPVEGNWRDALFLSKDEALDPADRFLGSARLSGARVGSGGYEAEIEFEVPGVAPGTYRLLLVLDRDDTVVEGRRGEADNVLAAPFAIAFRPLALAGALSESFSAGAARVWRGIEVPEGVKLDVTLELECEGGAAGLFIARDRPPSPLDAEVRSAPPFGKRAAVSISCTRAGTYYVLAKAFVFPDDRPCPFTLAVETAGYQLPGDCNQNGRLDVSDAVCLLRFLFGGRGAALPCGKGTESDTGNLKLLDWQGDGGLDVSDAVSLLSRLFLGGPPHALGGECIPIAGCAAACPDCRRPGG